MKQERFLIEELQAKNLELSATNAVLFRENRQLRGRQTWLERKVNAMEIRIEALKEDELIASSVVTEVIEKARTSRPAAVIPTELPEPRLRGYRWGE